MEDEWVSALHLSLLPDNIARTIARLALNAALDATYLLTLKYLPGRNVTGPIFPSCSYSLSDFSSRIAVPGELTE